MTKKAGSNGKPTGMPKMHWVNYSLTQSDKERLSDTKLETELAGFDVEGLIFEGFKYSIGVDEKNSCFVASLTFKQAGHAFHNWCLSGRGSTPTAARVSLLYRHLVVAEGDWSFFGNNDITEDDVYF